MTQRMRAALELLSSMRFAVSLLAIVAVASVIGTVLQQNQPYADYLSQFGPFWFPLFERLGLYSVYNAGWFLFILAFLVGSTSLCLWRNAPKALRGMGRFGERLREQAYENFPQHARFVSHQDPAQATARIEDYLRAVGFALRREHSGEAIQIAARAGQWRRLGYLLAHAAIVLICLGGLADSQLLLKAQLALGLKRTVPADTSLSKVPESARLAANDFNFRGNVLIPEGGSAGTAVVNIGDGILLQELPFTLTLRKFTIEHYSTGAPRLFASDVIVTDRDSGRSFPARIEVNHPLIYRGIAVYQASFDDGGSHLELVAHDLRSGGAPAGEIRANVGDSLAIRYGGTPYTLELVGFRPFNVESVAESGAEDGAPLLSRMKAFLGPAARTQAGRDLRNLGPSFQYKLRDTTGRAREYRNYMLPVQIEGRWFLLSGMRDAPNEPFRYLRLPLDESGRLDGFFELAAAMFARERFAEAGRRLAAQAAAGMSEPMRERLAETAARVLGTFSEHGFQSVAEFLEKNVPEAEREKAAQVYLRVLQGAAWQAWMIERERRGEPRLAEDATHLRFLQDGLNAVSDSFFYGAPLYLQLASFDEVKASVLQLTRSPGQSIVYLGCALLVVGVFAMLFIRERRLWIRLAASGEVKLAYAPYRRTLEAEREFVRHRDAIAQLLE